MSEDIFNLVYGETERAEIETLVDIYAPRLDSSLLAQNSDVLEQMEVMITSWGAPVMDASFLANTPNLKAVLYGAGSIRHITPEPFWDRGIVITSAYYANAEPVAEFTLSQILFCLKSGWQYALKLKAEFNYSRDVPVKGVYGSTVGIISLGAIGRRVCELLKPFNVNILAYDPYTPPDDLPSQNVRLCSLDEVFSQSDVVSLHTPCLKETEGLIKERHISSMKQFSSFINTSRGAIVNETEMIDVLRQRPDLIAVLDVTNPEPPVEGSPLYQLPNVVLTPHIAGSMSGECRRMGKYMTDELRRYVNGEKMLWQIDREKAKLLA
ncbi:MAG: hydroxyacid dehydrogenase [Armatimonadota bacterium]